MSNAAIAELEKIGVDIENEFEKVFKAIPSITAAAKVAVAGITALAVADPVLAPVATVIAGGATLALNGLTELDTVVSAYKASPGTSALTDVQEGIAAVQNNLSGIFAAAQVKSSPTATKIAQVVTSVAQGLSVAESTIIALHAGNVAAPAPAAPAPAPAA